METPTPQSEARGLYRLVTAGKTTLEALRAEVGNGSPYRRAVCWFLDREANRCKRIPEHTKARVIKLLKLGWSFPRIARALRIGCGPVQRLSKLTGNSHRKRGRGRRFTADERKQICNAIKSGKPEKEIEQQFAIKYFAVLRFRRQIGIFEDRRHRRVPPEQIREAIRAVENGSTWTNAAARINLSRTTLRRKALRLGGSP